MNNNLKSSVEFSQIIRVFNSFIEQHEIKRIFDNSSSLLDLIEFCNNEFEILVEKHKQMNFQDEIIKEKLELYLAFLDEINKIDKIDINKRFFYDENHPLFKKEYKTIFSNSIYEIK
jgi:hypothetical protein